MTMKSVLYTRTAATVGVDAKRLRVGDFRVVFTETIDTITILDIGPRGGIYDE
jgi:mRNA interferase RelE/StbE